METRTDMYGKVIRQTAVDHFEVYTREDGVTVMYPIGTGWTRALNVFNSMQPEGWVPPEPPPEVTDGSA